MVSIFNRITFVLLFFFFFLCSSALNAGQYYDKHGNEISKEKYDRLMKDSIDGYHPQLFNDDMLFSNSSEEQRKNSSKFEENGYISSSLGVAFIADSEVQTIFGPFNSTFNPSPDVRIALGYNTETVRVEGEIGYLKADIDEFQDLVISIAPDGNASVLSLMFNAFADFRKESRVIPYVCTGVGLARVAIDRITFGGFPIFDSDDDLVLAYQFGVGSGVDINDTTTLDIGYRFFATTNPQFEVAETEFSSHLFLVGIRFALEKK